MLDRAPRGCGQAEATLPWDPPEPRAVIVDGQFRHASANGEANRDGPGWPGRANGVGKQIGDDTPQDHWMNGDSHRFGRPDHAQVTGPGEPYLGGGITDHADRVGHLAVDAAERRRPKLSLHDLGKPPRLPGDPFQVAAGDAGHARRRKCRLGQGEHGSHGLAQVVPRLAQLLGRGMQVLGQGLSAPISVRDTPLNRAVGGSWQTCGKPPNPGTHPCARREESV